MIERLWNWLLGALGLRPQGGGGPGEETPPR